MIAFDNVGIGATTGRTPNTVEAMAHDAIAFLEAMGIQLFGLLDAEHFLEIGKEAVFSRSTAQR